MQQLRDILERKASEFDSARQKSVSIARAGMQGLKELVDFVESNILREIEEAFEINKFAAALEKLGECPSESDSDALSPSLFELEKLRGLALEDIASQLGPSKSDFLRAQEAIINLSSWCGKRSIHLPERINGRCVDSDCVEVVWSAVEGAVCYHVEMRHSSEGAFLRVYEGTETSYRVDGLCPGSRVLFRVRCVVGDGGVSEWSECVEASTPAATLQYLCAEGLTSSEIVVTWDKVDAPCDNGNDIGINEVNNGNVILPTYYVEMKLRNNNNGECEFKEIYNGNETRCIASNLESEEEYVFRVSTMVGGKCISKSGLVCGRTKVASPKKFRVRANSWDAISLSWDCVVSKSGAIVCYIVEMKEGGGSENENEFAEIYRGVRNRIRKTEFKHGAEYSFRIRSAIKDVASEWSNIVTVRTENVPEFPGCSWMKCPNDVNIDTRYSINRDNKNVATNISGYNCTVVGNAQLLPNRITTWDIKVLKSMFNDGHKIFIGVAPFDVTQDEKYNYLKCGWYFNCFDSSLYSGPPHNYRGKEYGPRKGNGQYVHTGGSVGVVVDTTKGDLSFVLDGVNLGVAYEGIPLDKPIVPCVILGSKNDSVELDFPKTNEKINRAIPVPSNVVVRNDIAWDSLTLSWDSVGGVSFYQVEMDGNKFLHLSKSNVFTKRCLLPDTGHCFRVRAVVSNEMSEWCEVVKKRTGKRSFKTGGWKDCSDDKYSIDEENSRIVTTTRNLCTIIGNTPVPLNTVTTWGIKILESKKNDGDGIYIGVAPSDINQNKNNIYNGWYFCICNYKLISGPPHNYKDKKYGPRKGWGEYTHSGDEFGIVMDAIKGELSFIINGVNHGIAYEGVPLDKPLVPCVIVNNRGDSIELVI